VAAAAVARWRRRAAEQNEIRLCPPLGYILAAPGV